MRTTVVCSSDGAAPPLRYLLFKGYLHMMTSELFTPPTPDLDNAPRPTTHDEGTEYKSGSPILLPSKPKAAFQWPPDCLWPFNERIRNPGWDGDA